MGKKLSDLVIIDSMVGQYQGRVIYRDTQRGRIIEQDLVKDKSQILIFHISETEEFQRTSAKKSLFEEIKKGAYDGFVKVPKDYNALMFVEKYNLNEKRKPIILGDFNSIQKLSLSFPAEFCKYDFENNNS